MPTPRTSKLDDPTWRRARAQKASQARTTLDYHVAKVVENAPALTPEQVEQLRQIPGVVA